jgi:UDP-N-acetylglucosamine--N-acetylmuramyl-(pentapeptide) pyrophosphoryl-undecaprenol N-acetylglucosamine transferase
LAEIAACGKPAVLIPYPYATSDHQKRNAEFFAKRGAALVVLDGELQGPKLTETIVSLIKDQKRLSRMAVQSRLLGSKNREATHRVVQLIRELAREGDRRY